MSVISKRLDKVETAMNARAGDLSLLSDEELAARTAAIFGKMVANKAVTIQEFAALAPAELARWKTRLESLTLMLGDDDFGLGVVSEMIEAAEQKQEERHVGH